MALFIRKKKNGGRVYVEINVSLHELFSKNDIAILGTRRVVKCDGFLHAIPGIGHFRRFKAFFRPGWYNIPSCIKKAVRSEIEEN